MQWRIYVALGGDELTLWGQDETDIIVQTIFQNSTKVIPKDPINSIPALLQIMVWHWPGDKPSSQPMMII